MVLRLKPITPSGIRRFSDCRVSRPVISTFLQKKELNMSGNRQWYLLNINICTLYIYIFEISSIFKLVYKGCKCALLSHPRMILIALFCNHVLITLQPEYSGPTPVILSLLMPWLLASRSGNTETGIFRANSGNTITADALAPCVTFW